jgi:AraC-like DNA-binding protein
MALGDPNDFLKDVQILGDHTRYLTIRADPTDMREWLQSGPACNLLTQHHISHVGIMKAAPPFEVIRVEQSGTFLISCFKGEGEVLADGEWKRIKTGQTCLLPPFVMNCMRCVEGKNWEFAWVRYRESRETTPIVSSLSPLTGPQDPRPLKAAIEGLHAEASGQASLAALHHWTELIHHHVIRFAQPHQPDSRLWKLWQRVEANLAKPWTLGELSTLAAMSEEHLRRLCRKEIGRSPMQHLTFLRLQRARLLLSVTDDKVEVISRAVGFESSFTFSNTFKKWIGWRPSEYRQSQPKSNHPHG